MTWGLLFLATSMLVYWMVHAFIWLDYEVTIPRWKFELARFGTWFVVFQVTFFGMLVIPLVAMRASTGHDSVYVP
ncbi:hypothetical protein [Frankia sp. QA3]|uniref:hypothetical protein n=1 Tax=Frankia sp. QA3 TaxID=710111 RepID=UPI00055A27DC|nr:hypothetical protein [Frankia sp. QA3]